MKIIILDEYGVLMAKGETGMATVFNTEVLAIHKPEDLTTEQCIDKGMDGLRQPLAGTAIFVLRRIGTVKTRDKVGGAA